MEDEDINKFLYGDEVEQVQEAMEKKTPVLSEKEKVDGVVGESTTSGKTMDMDEDEEDDFEIVLDGDTNKRGLTNISLSQQTASNAATGAATGATSLSASIGTLDLNAIGSLGGQSILDLDLDDETGPAGDKPWRKPGADVTDYFNYGFNEVTWRMYCLRQRVLREEYGNSKNNNIPPALANNQLILQGLFPKGTHITNQFYFIGIPPQTTSAPSHHYQQQQQSSHQQYQPREYSRNEQPRDTNGGGYHQHEQRSSQHEQRRNSRSRSRSRTRTGTDRGASGREREDYRPSRGAGSSAGGGYSRHSSSSNRRYN